MLTCVLHSFNADMLVVLDEKADAYNPNSIRASLGGVFSTPIAKSSPEELAAFCEEESTYNFLGLTWCLLTNTLLPNIYFNLTKKHKGTSGSKKIIDMREGKISF